MNACKFQNTGGPNFEFTRAASPATSNSIVGHRSFVLPLLLALLAVHSALHAQSVSGGAMQGVFGSVFPGGIQQRAYLPPIGGPGGGQFKAPCPDGQYLTGVDLHAADDVDGIRPVCAAPGHVWATAPFNGGPGGKPVSLQCPTKAPAVLAIDVAAEGAQTVIVNNIHLFCGQPAPGQAVPPYPSAIFDGPSARPSKPAFPGFVGGAPIDRTQAHEECPEGQIASGIHGRSGIWLDAVGLICSAAAIPVASTKPVVNSLGRATAPSSGTPLPPLSICNAAASARARNSVAAPALETQCNAYNAMIAANEKADLTPGPSGAPIALCDAAQAALDRNAPEGADLSAKCRASGGGQNLVSLADQLAASGISIESSDPLLTALRNHQPAGQAQRGFDIGVATTGADTQWGAGKQKILDSLQPAQQEGFKVASSFVLDRNRNADLAHTGATIAANDAAVEQARTADPDARYWLGFDIASGIFGDPAQGALGNKATGPGSAKIRDSLSAPAQKGFTDSTKFHLSRTY